MTTRAGQRCRHLKDERVDVVVVRREALLASGRQVCVRADDAAECVFERREHSPHALRVLLRTEQSQRRARRELLPDACRVRRARSCIVTARGCGRRRGLVGVVAHCAPLFFWRPVFGGGGGRGLPVIGGGGGVEVVAPAGLGVELGYRELSTEDQPLRAHDRLKFGAIEDTSPVVRSSSVTLDEQWRALKVTLAERVARHGCDQPAEHRLVRGAGDRRVGAHHIQVRNKRNSIRHLREERARSPHLRSRVRVTQERVVGEDCGRIWKRARVVRGHSHRRDGAVGK